MYIKIRRYDDFVKICAPSKLDALTGSAAPATGLDKSASTHGVLREY